MNVFVLCTGRCGSVTFSKACGHISNYTNGHETRCQEIGAGRIAYPANHIEVDNRLSWFLGRLDESYGDAAYYVHLIRDREQTAASFNKRWGFEASIVRAYSRAILMRGQNQDSLDVARDYWETVNANIRAFLKDKSQKLTIDLEHVESGFRRFWRDIAAEGDIERALLEWSTRHNASWNTG